MRKKRPENNNKRKLVHPVCSSLAILPRVCAEKFREINFTKNFVKMISRKILNQNMTMLIENEIQEVPIFFCNCCFRKFFGVSAVPCIYVAWK